MISQQILKEIIDTWLVDIQKKRVIQRREISLLKRFLSYKHIIAISGLRRSGKTYLMFQLIQELLKKHPNNVCYINFEDERFTDKATQLDLIYRTFLEHKNPQGKIYFFLDEIQNILGWEKWLARMYEKDIKFFVSGSNASLLSSDFSKALTGRHKLIELFPLSFSQFVAFRDKELLGGSFYVVEKIAKIKRLFNEYLKYGGLPEVVYDKKRDILKDYFKDILNRDVILRRNIKFKQSLREIALILLTNISRLHSLYSLNKILNARSVNTIKNYLSFLEDAYLLFRIPYFSFSLKAQIANPFKIYAPDTGLRNAVAFDFSKDIGWLYENLVAIEMWRTFSKENVFYWKNSRQREVDFVIKKGLKIKQLVQVCYELTDEKVKTREVNSLLKASQQFKCNNLLVITQDFEDEEKVKGKKIKFTPLWKWLLENQ